MPQTAGYRDNDAWLFFANLYVALIVPFNYHTPAIFYSRADKKAFFYLIFLVAAFRHAGKNAIPVDPGMY